MTEIEIGNNLVIIISLVVNAVLVPLIVAKTHECSKVKKKLRSSGIDGSV